MNWSNVFIFRATLLAIFIIFFLPGVILSLSTNRLELSGGLTIVGLLILAFVIFGKNWLRAHF